MSSTNPPENPPLSRPLGLNSFFEAVWSGNTARMQTFLDAHPEYALARTDQSLRDPLFGGRTYIYSESWAKSGQPKNTVTALHYAAALNNIEMAKSLLECGAEVDAVGYHPTFGNITALQLAAEGGEERNRLLSLLLRHGADPTNLGQNDEPETGPLFEGSSKEPDFEPNFGIVLEDFAPPAESSFAPVFDESDGVDPAVEFHEAVSGNLIGLVRVMLASNPLLINAAEPEYGYTPLASATTKEMADFLLENGVEPGIVESASLNLDEVVVNWLDADPSLVHVHDLKGRTALHVAIMGGNYELVKLLLRRGANPNTHWIPGWSPLHIAQMHNQKEIVELLRVYRARE